MTARVIQGFFVGGRPRLPSPVAQPKTIPRLPGPPVPAFARGAPVAQPRLPGPPAPAFAGRPPGPPAPAFAGRPPVAQRHGAGDAFAVDPGQLGLASSGGRPLPDAVRGKMEAALGADFSNVRVYVGPQAERIGAIAFTLGSDIYFAPGRFQPETAHGQQLLGHELAHVVQQRAGRVRNPMGSGVAVVQDRALEAEADRLGRHAAAHRVAVQAKLASGMAQPSAPVRISPPISAGPGSYRLTAGAGGHQVGSVMVHARDKGTVEVTDLGVDPAHREHGLGQMLLASAARAGQQFGRSKVMLAAQDNGSGHLTRWYKGMGFTPVGVNHRGFPQLEAPISRLLAGTAQRNVASPSSGTLQLMEQVTEKVTAAPGRRHLLWQHHGAPSLRTAMKLELPGSGHTSWATREESKNGQEYPGPVKGQKAWFRFSPHKVPIFTIAGPLAAGGTRDSGPNSIENNLELAKTMISTHVANCADKYNGEPVRIFVKAHSRNAVTCTLIVAWIKQTYVSVSPKVIVEAVIFDPVPGPGQPEEYWEADKKAIASLSESTLVYSINDQYSFFFKPQRVRGAKRLILSMKKHSVGMKAGVLFENVVYKGSRLNSLPPGLYIGSYVDEEKPEEIFRCFSISAVDRALQWEATSSRSGGISKGRHKNIMKVCESFLVDFYALDNPHYVAAPDQAHTPSFTYNPLFDPTL